MNEKFSLDSDFVDSFLNYQLIKQYYKTKDNKSIIEDARIFNNCVNMNPFNTVVSNCSDRRDRVNEFIDTHIAAFEGYKTYAKENCSNELFAAFGLNHSLNRNANINSSYTTMLNEMNLKEKEESLSKCLAGLS
jgi:hypothetical protein